MEQNKIFESVETGKVEWSNLDLSHERKFSSQMGALVPILIEEVLPGDRWFVQTEIETRFAPMIFPLQHRVNGYVHAFFIPNRIIWDDWEDFITGGDEATVVNPTMPKLTGTDKTNFYRGTVSDYYGIPTVESTDTIVTNYDFIQDLAWRAYVSVYQEYYRDQNLTNSLADKIADFDSLTDAQLCTIRYRCWEKDYFTSALPEAVRGGDTIINQSASNLITYKAAGTDGIYTGGGSGAVSKSSTGAAHPETSGVNVGIENIASIATNVNMSVNDLRLAIRTQEFWETALRVGSRYSEAIEGHFGIDMPDQNWRPEYVGGMQFPIQVSPVIQSSETGTTPQGTMTGYGIGVADEDNTVQFEAKEHGWFLMLYSVLPRTAYQQGVHKKFLRDDRFDYYWPEFAHLGEQEIENRELYFDATSGADDPTGIFGYQMRFSEYRFINSSVHGDYRTSLDGYHMGRQFSAEPDLNEAFVVADLSPTATEDGGITQRIFANTTEADHKLWTQLYHRVECNRPMPYFGTPGF